MREIFITRPFSIFAMILFSLALIALLAVCARADGPQPQPQPLMGSFKQVGAAKAIWTIEADKVAYDQEKKIYEADGNVKISAKDRRIEADHASVNNETRLADLRGKVTVQYGRNWIKGEHVTWNLDSETGWVDSGILFFAENNYFIQGESIAKVGPNEFELKKGFVTSCNPADPDWKIQFNEMTVTVGGTAWTTDASFWAHSMPVAYWPLFGMPVENDRQSGFLIPWAGETTINGYEIELPYFWAIRDDMDATFYAHYMEDRGFMGGVEYRIDNPEWGKGIFQFNFLHDEANPTTLAEDGYPFQAQNRFWLRGDYDVTLPWNIQAKVDLDFISDRNFLNEFTQGSAAFYNSDSVFRQYFGRSLMYDQTSLVRESSVYLEKRDESDLLSLDVRYWQNLAGGQDVITAQKLPAFSYSIIPTWIDNTPFYYTLNSSAVNYWRPQDTTEQRLDAYPRIYYPLHWGNYLDVESSVGFRTDSYGIQWPSENVSAFTTERAVPGARQVVSLINPYAVQWQNENSNESDFTERTVPDAKVEMSTRLNKEYQVDFMDVTSVQHAIVPEVSYEYATQSTFGNQTPLIDRLDQDQARNGVRYGFSTFLTGKEVAKDVNGNPILDADGNPTTIYRELVRFRLFQFYNIEPPSVPDPMFETQNIMQRGWSPVGIRLDLMPKKYLSFSYALDVDLNSQGQGGAQSVFMTLDSTKGQTLILSYQEIPDLAVNEVAVIANIKVYNNVYLNTYHDYSLAGIMFLQGYGIRYIRGCWGVGAGYERQGVDNRFVVTLDLLGLGSAGSQSQFFGRPQFGEVLPEYQHAETWMLTH